MRLKAGDLSHELVATDQLRPHPRNPRNGDLDVLAESIREHGQYRALVVSQDGYILAGNHTYAAALEQDIRELWVTRLPLDHDDPQAVRIMLVDNRAGDLAAHRYDDGLLVALLQELPDLSGTGFDDRALAELLEKDRDVSAEDDASLARERMAGLEYRIIIDCESEEHQAALLRRLEDEGLKCHLLIS
jgi:ParB-like chromosome segregation protein Spo0J